MKKAGKASGSIKPAPSKAAGKPGKSAASKPVAAGALLYAFSNGILTTCEVPRTKLQVHRQTFPKHRCGFFNGKLYFLEVNPQPYIIESDSLRELGTLKIYNPRTQTIESTVQTCKCNLSLLPLLVKGNELIDLGAYPRMISVSSGQRQALATTDVPCDLEGCGVRLMLNKTIYLAGGEHVPFESRYETEDDSRIPGGVYAVNCAGFKGVQLAPDFQPPLRNASIVPRSASEFLILGEQDGSPGTVAYSLKPASRLLAREGGFSRALGQCFSSCVVDDALFMLFDSGLLGRCDLTSGFMRVTNLARYEKLKALLWAVGKTRFARLPAVLIAESIANY